MARRVANPKLDSRSARLRLTPRREPYWTKVGRGIALGYRRTCQAVGTWIARRYDPAADQRLKYEALGAADDIAEGLDVLTFYEAQDRAREWHAAQVATAMAPRGNTTVKEAIASYVEFLKAERKTGADAEQRLAKHVSDDLSGRRVAELTADEIERFKRAMVRQDDDDPEVERRSKDSANRVLSYLKAALNRAFSDSANAIPSDAAWRRVKPFRMAGRARQVHLDPAESRRLVNSCTGAFRNLVTAALVTGARPPGELAGLRVRDLRTDLRTLTLRDGKTGGREIVLTMEATAFLAALTAGRDPDALLLPRDDGKPWGKNHHVRPMREAVVRAKLPIDTTIYSLRHTYASQALLAGMNLKLLAENMGTSVRMIEQHYGKFLAASRRELIEATAPKLGLKKPKVTPMQRGAA